MQGNITKTRPNTTHMIIDLNLLMVLSFQWIEYFFVSFTLFPLEKNKSVVEFKLCKKYSGYCKLVVRTME